MFVFSQSTCIHRAGDLSPLEVDDLILTICRVFHKSHLHNYNSLQYIIHS